MRINRRKVPEHGPWPANTSPVLQRIFASRGVTSPGQAELKLANLLSPNQLSGMDNAVDLLLKAIQTQKHIVIVGDFDCERRTPKPSAF